MARSARRRAGPLDRNRLFDAPVARLLQLGEFGFGLLEDGKVGVSVFPQREEILIGLAALGGLASERVGARQPEMRQHMDRTTGVDTSVVQEFLKLNFG